MKQKIEGGWEERFNELFWSDKNGWADSQPFEVKDFISTEIEKAKASERQRCVDILDKMECRYKKPADGLVKYGFDSAIDQAKYNLEQMK